MARGVEIEWTSKDEQIVRSLQAVERGMQSVSRRMEDVEGKSKKATDTASSGLQKAAGQAVNLATSLTGVGSAAAAVTAIAVQLKGEYDALIQRQRNAANTQLGAGEALREVRKSFVPSATMNAAQMENRLLAMAGRHGASVPTVAATAGEAFSAAGALSNEATMSAIETAVRVAPKNAGEQVTLASRYLDLMNVGGLTDARQAGGLLMQLAASSRVKSTELIGNNLVPAIASLASGGDSMESATELAATLNNLMLDAEGAQTRTALINLSAKLKEANVPGANTAARIAALQGDAEMREAFLKGGTIGGQKWSGTTFESAARAPIESWLSGSDLARRTQAAAMEGISPVGAASAADFEKQLAFVNSGMFQPVVDINKGGAASIEQRRLADRIGGLQGAAYGRYMAALEEMNLPGPDMLARSVRRANYASEVSHGHDPLDYVEKDLRFLSQHVGMSSTDRAFAGTVASEMAATRKVIEALREDMKQPQRVVMEGAPAIQQNAVQGFGR